MTMQEIITMFRAENPRFTTQAVTDETLRMMCYVGDKDVCARTRCIVGVGSFSTVVDTQSYALSGIPRFFDIDEFPGGGIAYEDQRLEAVTKAHLDKNRSNWRTDSSGTPKRYYRRGGFIFLHPTPEEEGIIDVDCVLLSDDFEEVNSIPYNGLTYLEPYHYALVKYLKWVCEQKKGGDRIDALAAKADYEEYIQYMQKMLGGTKFGPVRFVKPH